MSRVAVFIDYQNTYHGACRAFGDPGTDPPTMGHVDPHRLGILLTQLGEPVDPHRELVGVTVYRGEPGSKSHRKLRASFARQVDYWQSQTLLTVRTRPMRYQPAAWSGGQPSEWRGEEKGIDVMMSLDIVIGARDDLYDVAVVVSADTDLDPAIEAAVVAGKKIEVASWIGPHAAVRPRRIGERRIWNHWLDERRFQHVRDDKGYLEP